MSTSFVRDVFPLIMETFDFGTLKWLARIRMSSSFALPCSGIDDKWIFNSLPDTESIFGRFERVVTLILSRIKV